MLDPIADMLTRLRNAQAAGHKSVSIPASKFKAKIAAILLAEGFLQDVKNEQEAGRDVLVLGLKYHRLSTTRKEPAISEIVRVSTEGCRIYVKGERNPQS